MKRRSLAGLLFLFLTFTGCFEEDKFELSPFKEIKAFELPGQAGATTINPETRLVQVPVAGEASLESINPSLVEISNMATLTPNRNALQNFSDTVLYTVRAEDGSEAVWKVIAEPLGADPQLSNSQFDEWYDAGGYQEPGTSALTTIWGTANPGLTTVAAPNTLPLDLGNGDLAAKMVSVKAPIFVRMAAGTLYTGNFITEGIPSIDDPRSNINFGTPFTARPSAFQVDYRCLPGEEYQDADGNDLPGSDQADLYLLLEKREGDQVERIGTAWFRSDSRVEEWTTVEVPVKYGRLTEDDPEFEYANIREGESWGDPDAAPTHIVVVFSSSALGDFFTGAIGSELYVNNFQLLYQ